MKKNSDEKKNNNGTPGDIGRSNSSAAAGISGTAIATLISDEFKHAKDRISIDSPMSSYSTFKVGGRADVIFKPESEEELVKAISLARQNNIEYTVLGNGSNILVSDNGIRGLTIILGREFSKLEMESDTVISAHAGALLSTVAKFAASKELSSMEFAAGIPGSVGGAIYMNAGAYDGCMADIVIKTKGYDPDADKIFVLEDIKSHQFAYRKSYYENSKTIVLKVWLALKKGDKDRIKAKMDEFAFKRSSTQPLDLPSAGSTFKRPTGYFAGKLIEDSGLKGYRIGGACVCEKHAGFIVNDRNATARDVYDLILHTQKVVQEKHGVTIEPEVRIIGEW